MKKNQPLLYAILIVIGIYIGGSKNISKDSGDSKLNNIIQMIHEHYVDSLDYRQFQHDAINSILSELDPHSSYISTEDFKSVEEDMQGSFSGIGIEFNIIKDTIVVISPISGGPSEKLGIQSGDRITHVEEEEVANTGIKNKDVIKLLRGKRGSAVNISIKRKGENQLIKFTIIRENIPLYSVDAGIMLRNDIGYIKINRFAATTYEEMKKKTETLKAKGMKKLVLDFRNNPGGYLHIANQICDEFLTSGRLIVFTEGRNRKKQEIFATTKGSLENVKVITLINEGSASASEIVAGALQDNDRGLVIGRRSFGKGLVQEQIILNDGDAIRLTTQRYYTPSGRCIQKDYGVNNTDYYLEQYTRNEGTANEDSLKYTTINGRVVYGGGGITPDINIEPDSNTNYLEINTIIRNGWINQFGFEKSESLKKNNISNYKEINMTTMYNDFLIYLERKNYTSAASLNKNELKYLENLLLATIARNLLGNDAYYQVLSIEDEYIQTAINNF